VRVLVVSNLFPPIVRGGYEVECRDIVDHLRGAHDVVVLSSDHRRAECPPQDGVLRVLPFADDDRAGILRAPVAAVRGKRLMRRVLTEQRPDLVYVWNAAGLPFSALHVLHRSGVPVAYRVCEHWFGGIYDGDLFMRFLTGRHRGVRNLWALAVRAVNRLPALRLGDHPPVPVAISWNGEFIRAAAGVPRVLAPALEDVVHPVNAASDALADAGGGPPTDPPTVLFVGRLEAQKGVGVAIRALADLERRHGTPAGLTVVGDGAPGAREDLEALAAREGVAARVRFTGALHGGALREAVARASAWVVPSTWDEPAPMVCIEAALAGVPVIASRVGGIPELLRDGDEALLFERGDHAGCADALATTLQGDGVAERVRRARARGQELSHGPYLVAMDDFLARAAQALGAGRPPER
jgi:glycosyltransferase involved in cell wall biosynthesis